MCFSPGSVWAGKPCPRPGRLPANRDSAPALPFAHSTSCLAACQASDRGPLGKSPEQQPPVREAEDGTAPLVKATKFRTFSFFKKPYTRPREGEEAAPAHEDAPQVPVVDARYTADALSNGCPSPPGTGRALTSHPQPLGIHAPPPPPAPSSPHPACTASPGHPPISEADG